MLRVVVGVWNLLKLLVLLLVIALAFPFVWLMSVIGNTFSRTRGGALQMPVRQYRHKDTGHRVTLMGVIHVAKESYYQKMQSIIDQATAEQYTILYESVGKVDKKDLVQLPKKQRDVVQQMQSVSNLMQGVATHFLPEDVVYQKQGLTYPETWIRTDLDVDQVAAQFAQEDLRFIGTDSEAEIGAKDLDEMPEELKGFIQRLFGLILRLLPGIHAIRLMTRRFRPESRARDRIIITMRDEVAAAGILKHGKGADVLSIWGAAHMPGIHKRLVAGGYVHESTQWHDAF